jgi:hypothetical protein
MGVNEPAVPAESRSVSGDIIDLLSISLEPSPVIEEYKKGVDRTLLRENLRLTVDQRVRKMMSAAQFAEAVRDSRRKSAIA